MLSTPRSPDLSIPLLGDASKAQRKLGWKHRVTFEQLVEEMVDEDLKLDKQRTTRGS